LHDWENAKPFDADRDADLRQRLVAALRSM
jgi:hypothetical protein